jgi:hypothetical protein
MMIYDYVAALFIFVFDLCMLKLVLSLKYKSEII